MMSEIFGRRPWEPRLYRRFVTLLVAFIVALVVNLLEINLDSSFSANRALVNLFSGFLITVTLVLLVGSIWSRSKEKRHPFSAEQALDRSTGGQISHPGLIRIGPDRFITKRNLNLIMVAWTFTPIVLALLWAYFRGYGTGGYAIAVVVAFLVVWVSALILAVVSTKVQRKLDTLEPGE